MKQIRFLLFISMKIRTVGFIMFSLMNSVLTFLLTKVYPIMSDWLEMYVCMWISAGLSAIGIVFVAIFIHETKGFNIHT